MKAFDLWLQKQRIQAAAPFIVQNAFILDIGSNQGEIYEQLSSRGVHGVGVDPVIETDVIGKNFKVIKGYFPQDLPTDTPQADAVVMLAVLEHIPLNIQQDFAASIAKSTKKGGKLIITVPDPKVDMILEVLKRLGVIDGMSLEEHFGFDIKTVPALFQAHGFKLYRHQKFQLGLNNLFVFERL